MAEKVLIFHEDEVNFVLNLIRDRLEINDWDLNDEEEWCELLYLKEMEKKIIAYLDHDMGDDVREMPAMGESERRT
jgi:hypothetical protein